MFETLINDNKTNVEKKKKPPVSSKHQVRKVIQKIKDTIDLWMSLSHFLDEFEKKKFFLGNLTLYI